VRQTAIQPIKYIGINKLGTLLSSQTTGTSQVLTKKPGKPGTSSLFSSAAFQVSVIRSSLSNPRFQRFFHVRIELPDRCYEHLFDRLAAAPCSGATFPS
jgi:hypothetical protein